MMLEQMAYAKINLYLEITGQREDGYHDLDMIMQTVNLADRIAMERADDIQILAFHQELPQENTAARAARLFFEKTGIQAGAKIAIEKRIPLEAGLGGASADAAAVFKGLNELYGFPLNNKQLEEIAIQIGADVPFCLAGGCCRAQGIGEKLSRLDNRMEAYYLLLKPRNGVSTPKAYAQFHRHPVPKGLEIEKAIEAIEQGDLERFAQYTGNQLTLAAIHCCPEIRAILQALKNAGTPAALMSGSGSTCVGIFREEKDEWKVQQQMKEWDLQLNQIVRATGNKKADTQKAKK